MTALNLPVNVNMVTFDGDELTVIEKNGEYFVPLKPICEPLDLDWKDQRRNIQSDLVLNSKGVIVTVVAKDNKQREMLCLPLEYLNGWLFKINPLRYEGERREKIIRYQKECYRALYNHFFPQQTQIDIGSVKKKNAVQKTNLNTKKLEIAHTKADIEMEELANKMAVRIHKGNGRLESFEDRPMLHELIIMELEKLCREDLFNAPEATA